MPVPSAHASPSNSGTGWTDANPPSSCTPMVASLHWPSLCPSMALLPTYIILHHTSGNRCNSKDACLQRVKHIQKYHMGKKGWPDIGYNFLIGEDGRVYEGRGWHTIGTHTKGWNEKSLGFSFLGTFFYRAPNATALNAAESLIQCAISEGYLSRRYTLKGHRRVSKTDCPWNVLYKTISKWPKFKS
uniref:Peptidoglycan-recognition protein n=1 Tax=Pelusios castaneus TaxID=367368 RepID=A0A8C8SRR2_9SAUR